MTARGIRRVALGAIAATVLGIGSAGAPALANTEETPPGGCDSNAPTVAGFVCFDSDDVAINLQSAQTKYPVGAQHIDVDWYTNGSAKRVRVNGYGYIKPNQIGTLTLKIECQRANGSVASTTTRTAQSAAVTHPGIFTPFLLNVGCPNGQNINRVKVTLKFVTIGGTQQQTKTAQYGAS